MAHTRIALFALATITVVGAGCGSNRPSNGPDMTRAELTARADAVCRRMNTMRHSITTGIASFERDYVLLLPPLVAYERSAVTELGRLTPPASLAGDWQEIITNIRTLTKNTATTIEYARSNNLKGLSELNTPDNEADQRIFAIATRDGFSDCAEFAA